MKNLKKVQYENMKLEEVKESCRAYLCNTQDAETVAFVLYSLISYSSLSELTILNRFIKEFDDREGKLQISFNKYSDFKYCISNYLANYYLDSSKLSIADFLREEEKIFDFVFKIALFQSNDGEDDKVNLLNCISMAALTA